MRTQTLAAIALSFTVVLTHAAPPRVVSTTPAHAQAGVDPATDAILAHFSKPMLAGSHSWVGGGPLFPALAGDPSWPTDRLAVLPVVLEPDHDYQLSLNGYPYLNFRSAEGEALMPTPLIFSTKPYPTTQERNVQAVDELIHLLETRYSHRDRLGVDWRAHVEAAREALVGSESTLALAVAIAELLEPARDVHLYLRIGDLTLPTRRVNTQMNVNPRLLSRLLPEFRKRSDQVFTARPDEQTAYLLIASWELGDGPGPAETALAAVREFADVPNLIIDVRPNSGGDELQARQVAACFVDEPVVYARNDYADPDAPSGFSEMFDRVLSPNDDAPRYLGDVYVLSGPAVMSSCEAFVLMMRAAGAHVVGDNTFGSSGNPKPHTVASDITLLLPSWRAYTAAGFPFEGEGIAPDTRVTASPRDLERSDPVLDAALDLASQNQP